MNSFSKSTIFGLTLGILLAGYAAFLVFNQKENFPAGVEAGTAQNVSGYAWSENIGWISFNCTNDHDENTAGVQTCTAMGGADYGVNIDNLTGAFFGFAWSSNIGWIKFNPAGPYPEAPLSPATLDFATNQVSGWARACAGAANPDCTGGTNPDAGGWDGWIKMRGVSANYGVSWNSSTKEFTGFAWGSDVIGWLSVNCSDLGVCGTSNYKVTADINTPPSASGLSILVGDYCAVPSHVLSWIFSDPEDGSTQTSYELQADNNADFLSPEVSVSGGSGTSYTVIVAVSPGANQLAYNTTYNWRVKVFDSDGADSGWVNGTSFGTKQHLYPDSNFTFSPTVPSQGEKITFTQASTCYSITNSAISCPAVATNYSWDFDYETPPFTQDAIGQTATTTYSNTSVHTVALDTADADANTCRGTQNVTPKRPLPKFKETAPSS
jgi:hypothetical protein